MLRVRTRWLLPLLLTTACTASKANIQIVTAEEHLRQARDVEADRISAYEYTMATRYLEKAREEAGFSDFRVADALARHASEWADRAIIAAERKGRSDIRIDDFQERPAPAPTAAPAPPSVPAGLEDILGPTTAPAPAPAPAPADDLDDDDDVELPK